MIIIIISSYIQLTIKELLFIYLFIILFYLFIYLSYLFIYLFTMYFFVYFALT